MADSKFQIFNGTDGMYYFHLRASNGEVILSSEGYSSRQSSLTGIASVKTNAPIRDRYQSSVSSDWQYYFILKAPNGETIGKSQMYTTATARDSGIAAVMNAAPKAIVE